MVGCSLIFFHFLWFCVGCSKSDFFWASISLRFLLTGSYVVKCHFCGPSRVVNHLWSLFSFFSWSWFFSTVFCRFFLLFKFSFFCWLFFVHWSFLHFLIVLFFVFILLVFSCFSEEKSFFFSFCLVFLSNIFVLLLR